MREQRQIVVVLQRDPEKDEPGPDDLHRVGTVANILRYVTRPDGDHHLICQGVQRFRITEFVEGYPFLLARGLHLAEPTSTGPEIEARFLLLQEQVREVARPAAARAARAAPDRGGDQRARPLADLAATYIDVTPAEKQDMLETIDLVPRLDKVSQLLAHRLEVLRLSAEIGRQTKASLDERQREMLLREQMAAIQRELGDEGSNKQELADLEKAIAAAKMPTEVEAVARKELRRLQRMPEAAAEYGMIRTYLDWLIELPWAPPEPRPSTSPRRAASSTPITTAWRRSSSASSNTWRCASWRPRARRRSCASSARPASARPRSASRSPAPWAASSRASAWAACTTRPRSAATGAPTSARCPATSSRRSARPARATA